MKTPVHKLLTRWNALETERSSWDSHYQELSDNFLPRTGQFHRTKRNDGNKRHQKILDSTAPRALKTLAAGMMAGMTSPARPWFRLTTSDPNLDEADDVKRWLADVQRRMLMLFGAGNTYRALHSLYEEIALYGTGASLMVSDFDNVIWQYPLTAGEYAIATDYRGNVNTLYREFERTVAEVVGEFGLDNVSKTVRRLFDSGTLEAPVPIVHAIEPRKDRDPNKRTADNMPWASCYFELGQDNNHTLRESGFRRFPGSAPRWHTSGGDVYGNGPAMEALGDAKQLQHQQKRKAQAIDYMTMPPLEAPAQMKGQGLDTLPGGVSYYDSAGNAGGVKSLFEVRLNLNDLSQDMAEVRGRIREAFYADLFLMLANSDRRQMTATEVAERHEEKLLMLGPVLERLHNELLSPLINNTFDYMVEANLVPPPPEQLQGRELSVEFVSMLAQAQRAVATNGVDRLLGTLGAVAQFKPDVVDKLDGDRLVDLYADMLGVDPDVIVPGEQVAIIREQRAEQARAQAEAEQATQVAGAAKDLSQARTDQPSALTDVMQMFSGYTTPQGV